MCFSVFNSCITSSANNNSAALSKAPSKATKAKNSERQNLLKSSLEVDEKRSENDHPLEKAFDSSTQTDRPDFELLQRTSSLSPATPPIESLLIEFSAIDSMDSGQERPEQPRRPVLTGFGQLTIGPPELKLENLNRKKKTFYFNQDKLDEKPNDPKEQSNQLDELTSALKSLEPSPDSRAGRRHVRHHSRSKLRDDRLLINNTEYEFKMSDLETISQIGHGEFGSVHKVRHSPSGTVMAMKRVGPTVGSQIERRRVLNELDFVTRCDPYEFVVIFYGVKINQEPADCLIFMELMDSSLDKFYRFVYEKKQQQIPERVLARVAKATLSALNYLKEELQIIHRDVKPSNILINRRGCIKICDFGISGQLVDSIAASRDAGCQLYMAPERIDPSMQDVRGYDVRSDVWSLGLTLYELATGQFPYPEWSNLFQQLKLVVDGEPPCLKDERLSETFRDFVNTCLRKAKEDRPKYKSLLQHPLITDQQSNQDEVGAYFTPFLDEMKANLPI